MDDLSSIVKLCALTLIAVGALAATLFIGWKGLTVAYKVAKLIHSVTTCKTLPHDAAAMPVPERENITPITDAVTFERRVRNTG